MDLLIPKYKIGDSIFIYLQGKMINRKISGIINKNIMGNKLLSYEISSGFGGVNDLLSYGDIIRDEKEIFYSIEDFIDKQKEN